MRKLRAGCGKQKSPILSNIGLAMVSFKKSNFAGWRVKVATVFGKPCVILAHVDERLFSRSKWGDFVQADLRLARDGLTDKPANNFVSVCCFVAVRAELKHCAVV